jgi:hypothetical protein
MNVEPKIDHEKQSLGHSMKISVSMPAEILQQAKARARALGYPKVSHYFAFLAARDLAQRTEHTRSEKECLDNY